MNTILLRTTLLLLACLHPLSPLFQSARAQPDIYYASTSNDVDSVSLPGLTAGPSVLSGLFNGVAVGGARNIQIDPDDRLLWYAATDGNIDSINLTNSTDGPSVPSGVFQGANSGGDRHFSIDALRNLLYYSVTDGSIQVIDLDNNQTVRTLNSGLFRGASPGGLRHTAIDPVNNLLYYAVSDNSIVSFSLNDPSVAGPTIPSNRILGAAAGAFRHIIYNPNTRLLHYMTAGDAIESINPFTLAAGPTITSGLLTGTSVGAGRPITIDAPVLPADVVVPRNSIRGGVRLSTSANRLVIRGKAIDLNGIRQVLVALGRSRPVVARGTTNWSHVLKFRNATRIKVKVTAIDFAGNRKVQNLIATRKPKP